MGRSIPVGRENSPDDVGELLDAVTRRIRTRARDDLQPLGVTPAQLRTLRTVSRHSEPVRMSALAEQLGVARRSATSLIDHLAERGLVERLTDPDDRRGVAVGLTSAGSDLMQLVRRRRQGASAELLGGLSTGERQQLADLLRRLLADRP